MLHIGRYHIFNTDIYDLNGWSDGTYEYKTPPVQQLYSKSSTCNAVMVKSSVQSSAHCSPENITSPVSSIHGQWLTSGDHIQPTFKCPVFHSNCTKQLRNHGYFFGSFSITLMYALIHDTNASPLHLPWIHAALETLSSMRAGEFISNTISAMQTMQGKINLSYEWSPYHKADCKYAARPEQNSPSQQAPLPSMNTVISLPPALRNSLKIHHWAHSTRPPSDGVLCRRECQRLADLERVHLILFNLIWRWISIFPSQTLRHSFP